MPKLSIHLLTYNGLKYLPYCLSSLADQIFQDFSVLIIDNASIDGTSYFIKQYLANPANNYLNKKTKFVANVKNIGFAGGHNQALHWTKSEYVLLMNQDIIMAPDYLKFLVEFLEKIPDCAAATGKLLRWDFKSDEYKRESLTSRIIKLNSKNKIIDSAGLKIFKKHQVAEISAGQLDNNHKETARPVFGVSGALPMYRRSALESVKIKYQKNNKIYSEYFDNDFLNYKEDVDLAYRLCLAGCLAYLIPQAQAWHDRTLKAGRRLVKNRQDKSPYLNYLSYRNHLYFLIKNAPFKILIRHGWRILFYEVSKLIYLILFEQKILTAWIEVIKNLKLMLKKRRYIQKQWGRDGWKNIEKLLNC